MSERLSVIRDSLKAHGQDHVLRFYDELSAAQRSALLAQIEGLNLHELDELIGRYVRRPEASSHDPDLEPAPYYGRDGTSNAIPYDPLEFRATGEGLIREGKIAAFTVAGGQGTRLGWNGPKGTYPATVVTGKPLFRCFAEQILATERKYEVTIPWYIMTSPLNDEATRSFFLDNNCFGLIRKNIFMFPQGVMPSFERDTGRLMLSSKHEIAVNPDGHGGAIRALARSGAVEDMLAREIEHISYFQVDNPLVRVIDPLFIGLHSSAPDSSGEMSSKMVAKAGPEERVGVFARRQGKTVVIEYSDLPESLAQARNDDGSLRFNAGSMAIHLIGVDFIQQLTADPDHSALPYHRAEKKVPFVDLQSGDLIEPEGPNAVKLETFIFDAIPLARSSIVLETDRTEEFAPIKNAKGADSPATSHRLQSNRHGRWLEAMRIAVPYDDHGDINARIEISPLTALDPADLADLANGELPEVIAPGAEIVL